MADMYGDGREILTESKGESFKDILLKYRDNLYDPARAAGKTAIGMHSIKLKLEILLKAHWEWTSDCEQTFRLLKEKLSSSPVLAYPEIDGEEFILDTDASHFGIGANKDFCKQCNLPWDYVYNNSSDKSDSLNIIDQQCETQHSQIISTIDENENEDLDSEDLPKRRGPKRNAPSKAKGLKKPVIDLSPESIRELQVNDPGIGPVLKLNEENMKTPTTNYVVHFSQTTKFWISRWDLLEIKNGMLCEYWEDGPTYSRWRVCAPCEIQKYVLWQIHDSPTSGHQGINRTWQRDIYPRKGLQRGSKNWCIITNISGSAEAKSINKTDFEN
ncbi:unnamed protein product [Mytilus edulis]|uniref:Reverse transcriptase/retrotransposon-derived protein RNase H-like domain-containing protein n=1 Tax=Mytilus edulis TaxID=6550 RepID=A0A8S3SVT7_MYTED|nr:unnamed protein product [Mytilus edulis]